MQNSETSFSARLDALDPTLFATIASQSTASDQRAMLALHAATRAHFGSFSYLEIGSHIGGSMQALVADPLCTSIISLDPRPTVFADERGIPCHYPDNSTERMMEHLAKVPSADLTKIRTIESDTRRVAPETIAPAPHFCFIDAEHTTIASLNDARFCLKVSRPDGIIAFHDANVVFAGIDAFLAELEASGRAFKAYLLPDAVFVVELGEGQLIRDPRVLDCYMNSWKGYLFALRALDWYRAVLNKPLFRLLRRTRFVRRLFIVR
jgi:predicted O-methyltransferase YrrM